MTRTARYPLWMMALVLGIGFASFARASNAICTLTPGNSVTSVGETCGQAMFVTTDYLNWGQAVSQVGYSGLGTATSAAAPGSLDVMTFNGLGVTVSAGNMMLERADNTIYGWSNTLGWTYPAVNTFGGHFGAPVTPGDMSLGDNLLGVVPESTVVNSSLDLVFNQTVTGAAFRVSSLSTSDFVATLKAFDASNNLLATYVVTANGLGGACMGLQQPGTIAGGNPIQCNDAPLIQIADALGRIKSVMLMVNDPQGAFIDQLSLSDDAVAPEPSFGAIVGIGILGFGLWAKRKRSTVALESQADSSLD